MDTPSPCQSRGTLFQWSYGTSFSGGPDLDAPLVTDRPDFTEASSTVGRGVAQSWTLAYTLTERLGAYTEWFSLIPTRADTFRTQSYCNGGFTFLINDNIQWDIRAGTGLNDAADDFFAGAGLSIRFR